MARPPSPWKLGGLSLAELARRVWYEFEKDEILDRSAALSYYFIFAFFPTLLFLAALLGLLPSEQLMDRLLEYLGHALPPDAASVVGKTLGEVLRGARGSLLSVGVLAALWAASNGMGSIMTALNAVYDVTDTRPWWKGRLIAVGLTVAFALFTLTALVLLVVGPRIAETLAAAIGLGPAFTFVWNVLRWPVAVVMVLIGVELVYYLAPHIKRGWMWITPGSAFAVAAWLAASAGLQFYVTRFANYNATYGSIGGAILFLLWLYLTGLALLVGAEINSEISRAVEERSRARQEPRVTEKAA
jgi:membrane protein